MKSPSKNSQLDDKMAIPTVPLKTDKNLNR
jgi:hypothetical protein